MPRAPTACRIGRSRLALLAQLLPAAAVAGLLGSVLPPGLWLPVTFCLVLMAVWSARRQPAGELSAKLLSDGALHDGTPQWYWRNIKEPAPRPVSLRCDYLGPWLIGLRLDGRRLWLWPDSCSPSAHRELRRYLIRH
uniref:protein YgfX n=1 Tax=uncultured Halomonas sp. TaxID=173971 RepID=UPI00261A904D|nr:protein YgfX [uncultured Halomonas sp.]